MYDSKDICAQLELSKNLIGPVVSKAESYLNVGQKSPASTIIDIDQSKHALDVSLTSKFSGTSSNNL